MKHIIKPILLSVCFITISNYAVCQNFICAFELSQKDSTEIRAYNKPRSSNRLFKTTRGNLGVWADQSKWVLADRKLNQDAEFQLNHVSGDAYAIVISEKTSTPMEDLKDVAIKSAMRASPDARIVAEERRIVNGREIVSLVIESTVRGIPFTYYGYYHSGKEGTAQVITMTGKNMFQERQQDFTELLNGMVVLEKDPSLPVPEVVQGDPRLKPGQDGLTPGGLPIGIPGPPTAGPGTGGGVGPGRDPGGSSNTANVPSPVDKRPVPLNLPKPSYTEEARRNKVEGLVIARALVGADGTVKQVKIIHGLPDGLDEMATQAIYQIKFQPAMKDNKPVAFWLSIQVEFNLCTDCKPQKQ